MWRTQMSYYYMNFWYVCKWAGVWCVILFHVNEIYFGHSFFVITTSCFPLNLIQIIFIAFSSNCDAFMAFYHFFSYLQRFLFGSKIYSGLLGKGASRVCVCWPDFSSVLSQLQLTEKSNSPRVTNWFTKASSMPLAYAELKKFKRKLCSALSKVDCTFQSLNSPVCFMLILSLSQHLSE